MGDVRRVAILGAGAMGTALAVHSARSGAASVLLATDHDEAVVDRWRRGLPHPPLDLPFHHHVRCVAADGWAAELPDAEVVFVAVSSAGLPRVPRLYRVPAPALNAFAAGSREDPAIALTDGLLMSLEPRELAGVLAHELSHVRARDVWVMTLAAVVGRMTSLMSFFGQMLLFILIPVSLFTGQGVPLLAIVLLIFAPTISGLLQLALSRTREFDADVGAIELTGDPRGLASALAKLERQRGGWMQRLFMARAPSWLMTHPSTDERIRRLMALERAHALA